MNQNYLFCQEDVPRLFIIGTWNRAEQVGEYIISLCRDETQPTFRLASVDDPPDRKVYVNIGAEYFDTLTENDKFMLMLDGEGDLPDVVLTTTLDFEQLQIFDFLGTAEPQMSDTKTFVTTHYLVIFDRMVNGASFIGTQNLAFVTADAVVHSLDNSQVGYVTFFNENNQAVKLASMSSAASVDQADIDDVIVWYDNEQPTNTKELVFESEEGAASVVAILDNEVYHQKRM